MSAATVVLGVKLAAADLNAGLPSAPPLVVDRVDRDDRDAMLEVLDSVCESDKKRRFDAERLGGGKKLVCCIGEEIGGEFGPRSEYRR